MTHLRKFALGPNCVLWSRIDGLYIAVAYNPPWYPGLRSLAHLGNSSHPAFFALPEWVTTPSTAINLVEGNKSKSKLQCQFEGELLWRYTTHQHFACTIHPSVHYIWKRDNFQRIHIKNWQKTVLARAQHTYWNFGEEASWNPWNNITLLWTLGTLRGLQAKLKDTNF